ncbi:ATP-binding protein [Rurimicrobium arvi]|uniref:histidine kinase n=1 Tax=Rurimicrobium arvi TaxID=2049916 RepID=A0ABP8MEB2_9BACT
MILIVDDKSENIFSLKKVLEQSHFPVDEAHSGEEALLKVLRKDYALIILDVQMPGMDGFEVAEALAGTQRGRDIPIIFLSAVNIEKRFITRGYASGAVDYVTKPVDPDIFILKVKTLYRLSEQHRELVRTKASLTQEVEVRRQTEKNLKRLSAEQQTLIRSFPQIVFTVTPDGVLEFVNERWFEYSASKTAFPEVHPDDQRLKEEMDHATKQDEPFVSEIRLRHLATGTFRYHLLRMIPLIQGKSVVKWVGTFTDIQEQKDAHDELDTKVRERTKELMQKNAELELSNHELQQFASVASHDLQEPLRKIQIYSNRIRERCLVEGGDALTYMDRVIDASRRMSSLISDLLSYSRLSIKSLFQRTNLNELIEEILIDLEFSIKDKGAVLDIQPLPEVECVAGQIRQVFQNLISNALKFSVPGTPPRISISGEEYKDASGRTFCHIYVRDNGIGFDEQYLDKIFTIFQRLNAKEEYEGTGIGLAIVKKIIEKHGGTITARSAEGEGATFIISLPVTQNGDTHI